MPWIVSPRLLNHYELWRQGRLPTADFKEVLSGSTPPTAPVALGRLRGAADAMAYATQHRERRAKLILRMGRVLCSPNTPCLIRTHAYIDALSRPYLIQHDAGQWQSLYEWPCIARSWGVSQVRCLLYHDNTISLHVVTVPLGEALFALETVVRGFFNSLPPHLMESYRYGFYSRARKK